MAAERRVDAEFGALGREGRTRRTVTDEDDLGRLSRSGGELFEQVRIGGEEEEQVLFP